MLLLRRHLARCPRLQIGGHRLLLLQLLLQLCQLVLPPPQLILQVGSCLPLAGRSRLSCRNLLLQQLCLCCQAGIVCLLGMQQLLLQRRHGCLQLCSGGAASIRIAILHACLKLADALVADLQCELRAVASVGLLLCTCICNNSSV